VKRVLAVAAVILVLLAGCTPSAPTPGPPGTVVATGEFDPDDGVTGTVELVVGKPNAYSDTFEVHVSGFSSDLPVGAELMLSPFPLTPDRTCLDGPSFGLGALTGPDQVLLLGDFRQWQDDPSFLDGAVIAQYVEADALENDCQRTILARAPFTWSMPDLRPGLKVADSGSTTGATGKVTEVDGEPVSYHVAAGDLLGDVADRFGLTLEDLDWLNPFRGVGAAVVDEELNLDRDNRNAPFG